MDTLWETHKESIRDLYLVQDKARKEVMREMEVVYGFSANAGQYQRQFKKWGFRKNLTPKEWQFVSRRMEKRKREEQETVFKIDGVAVPEKKLKKAISRYGQGSTLEKLQRKMNQEATSRSPTPEGLSFSPIIARSSPNVDSNALSNFSLPSDSPKFPGFSPFPDFGSLPDVNSLQNAGPIPSFSPLPSPRPFQSFSPLPSFSPLSSFSPLPDISLGPDVTFVPDVSTLPCLRFSQWASPIIQEKAGAIGHLKGTIFRLSEAVLRTHFRRFIPDLSHLTKSPFENLSDVQTLDAFAFAVFLTSNHIESHSEHLTGAADPDGSLAVRVIRTLQTSNAVQALNLLGTKHESTIDALSELLFKEALLSQNISLTKLLLTYFRFDLAELLPGPWPPYEGPQLRCRSCLGSRLPLQVAVESGNIRLVQLLLDYGPDVNAIGASDYAILEVAAFQGFEEIFRLLHRNFQGTLGPIILSCLEYDASSMIDCLWDQVRDSDLDLGPFENEILIAAARAGQIRIVQELLENGAEVNVENAKGASPLAAAVCCTRERLEVVKLLIEWDADVNSLNHGSEGVLIPTPLQIAVIEDEFEVATLLLDNGANPNEGPILSYDSREPRWLSQHSVKFVGYCALEIALQENKRPLIELLLEHGAIPGELALGIALHRNDPPLIEMLLEHGAIPGELALGIALRASNRPLVEFLLEHGAIPGELALVNAMEGDCSHQVLQLLMDHGARLSENTLIAASRARDSYIVRLCLDAGLDANCFDKFNSTPLNEATEHRPGFSDNRTQIESSLEICGFLVENGADVNCLDWLGLPPLAYALRRIIDTDCKDLVDFFLSKGAHCDKEVILEKAVETRDPAILETILDHAASRPSFHTAFTKSCLGHRALFSAAGEGDRKVISVLIQRGINLHSACATEALRIVLNDDNLDHTLVEDLLARGAPVNVSECGHKQSCVQGEFVLDLQPLAILVRRGGCDDAIRLLLKYGANPDLYEKQSFDHFHGDLQECTSILSAAAEEGHLSSVRLLLNAGAKVNKPARGKFGRTALQSAVQEGQFEIVEEFLHAGADVNIEPAEEGGVTALQAAAIEGFVGIAARLLEHGADVNAPPARVDGRTALEGACEWGRIDMVDFLIRAGAELYAPQYERALELARGNGYNAVARLLRRHKERQREDVMMDDFLQFPE